MGTPLAKKAIKTLETTISHIKETAQWQSKTALALLADASTVALLFHLSESAGEIYAKFAELYAARYLLNQEYPSWAMEETRIWDPLLEVSQE